MFQIQDTIVSREVLQEQFLCDLNACKGACCVEGDAGAPLEKEELQILEDVYEKVKPYLRKEGVEAIEEQGTSIIDIDGDYVTPLVKGKECAYTIFDEKGTAKCGIEKAYLEKKISFQKPISCHLYPVRITKYAKFDALNYHEWKICQAAKICGKKEKLPMFIFVKDALIRKYGADWYEELTILNREQI